MLIRDVMTREVISVFPDSSVEEVAQIIIKIEFMGFLFSRMASWSA